MTMLKSKSIILVLCFATAWTQLWPQKAILVASNKASSDQFGKSVSLTNNYAVVGANAADPGAINNAGAAYVFIRSDSSWTEQAILVASNKAQYDFFGCSVSLTDNHALVGASNADPGSFSNAGAAYVFVRSGVTWTEQAILTASVKTAGVFLGTSVSLIDTHAVVGAPGDNYSTNYPGAAYVFVRSGVTWTQQTILIASNKVNRDWFGYSTTLSQNYALIGAYGADPGGILSAGAAYVFIRSGATWAEQAILTASDKVSGDEFGFSTSLTDNYALVGAHQAGPNAIYSSGAAYVFVRSNTTWTQQAILTASNKSYSDKFGYSVSLTDNYALMGAYQADPGSVNAAGAAYLFVRSGTVWNQQAILTASNKVDNNQFGSSTSLTDNYAFVGAWYANPDSMNYAGATYFYQYEATQSRSRSQSQSRSHSRSRSLSNSLSISPSPQPIEADILSYQSTRSGNFGNAVALMNDTLIASSPTCIDQSRCDGGRAAVFKKDINGNTMFYQMLQGRHRNADAMFGYSLAVNNYWLAITSKGTSYLGAQTALVSIFGKNPDTDAIERVAGLRPKEVNQPNMEFGHSIAVGQFDIIVGVPGYALGTMIDIGAIMSFRLRISINRWGRNPVVATAFDAAAGDRFGHSVSFDEAFLAVGNNPSDDTRYAVYILTKSGFEFAHIYKISGNGKRGFGWSVLLSENELIVGSPQDDNNGASTNGGSVSVFAKNSTNHFVEYDTIRHTPIVAERRFGFAVARKGNRMAIGTNTCPNGAPCALKGKAYLYTKSGQQWVPRRSFSSGHADGSDSFGTRVTINEEDFVVGAPYGNNGSGRVYAYYVPEISG